MQPHGTSWFSHKINELFGIDLRSLAAFRIGIGLMIFSDVWFRAEDLSAHYTDWGMLPRASLLERIGLDDPIIWSFLFWSGRTELIWPLFVIAGIASLMLMVGYKTRLAGIIAWIWLCSLHARNGIILEGSDNLLRVLLFWGLFLPMGARWSIDAVHNPRPPPARPGPEFSLHVASFALMAQMILLYFCTGILKDHLYWEDGRALLIALNLDGFATALGQWLKQFTDLNAFATQATRQQEIWGAFLVFCPVFTGPVRLLTVLAFWGLHAGIELTLEVGLFSLIAAAGWLVFVPPWFWDAVLPFLARCFPPLRPLADAFVARVSSLASIGLVDFDAQREAEAAAMEAPAPVPAASAAKAGRSRQKRATETATRRREREAEPWHLAGLVGSNLAAAVLIAYAIGWNVRTLVWKATMFRPYEEQVVAVFPRSLNWFGFLFRIDQYWSMFAPFPSTADGWYVMPGTLANGTQVDLFRRGASPVDWSKPKTGSTEFGNNRWRKYLVNLHDQENAKFRDDYAYFLCRWWNHVHSGSERLVNYEVYFRLEETLPTGEPSPIIKDIRLITYTCPGPPQSP